MIWHCDLTLAWPDLRSNFELDLSRSKSKWFELARRGKNDGIIFILVSLISKKLLMMNNLREKRQLFIWRPVEPTLLTLGQIVSQTIVMAWRELPNALYEFFLAITLVEIIAIACEKIVIFIACEKSLFYQNLTFGDLWWPQYWHDLKMSFIKVRDIVAFYLIPFTACP